MPTMRQLLNRYVIKKLFWDRLTDWQVAEMYEKQALAQSSGKKKKGGDDDGFW